MVSTRGGSRTDVDIPEDSSLMLRKKPVRKATAKASSTTAAKAKTTRSQKATPEPIIEAEAAVDAEGCDASTDEQAIALPRSTKKTTTRATEVADRPVKGNPKKAAAAKDAITKSRAKAVDDEETPLNEEDAPTLRPGTRARAVRATRATVVKERTQPLSPKKITQIVRAPSRASKASAAKEANAKAKAVPKGRTGGRKQTMSDENAKDEDLAAVPVDCDDVFGKPARLSSRALRSAVSFSDASGPSSGSAPHPEQIDSQTADESESEDELAQDDAHTEDSGDELCGPKTPMKRCSPGEGSRYCSAQPPSPLKSRELRTPARHRAALGARYVAPQTQKPCCKSVVTMDNGGPMTTARAHDRAMVFPELQPLATLEEAESHEVTPEASLFLVDNVSRSSPEADNPYAEECASFSDDESGLLPTEEGSQVGIDPQKVENADDADIEAGGEVPLHEVEHNQPGDLEEDLSETTIIVDDGICSSPSSTASIDLEDTVLIHQHPCEDENDSEDECDVDESLEDATMTAATSKPQTLVWENLQDDAIIQINYDALDMARSLPEAEPTERLTIIPGSLFDAHLDRARSLPEAEPTERLSIAEQSGESDGPVENVEDDGGRSSAIFGESPDDTVNLSDFIDLTSLVEASQSSACFDQTCAEAMQIGQDEEVQPDVDQTILGGDLAKEHLDTAEVADSTNDETAAQDRTNRIAPPDQAPSTPMRGATTSADDRDADVVDHSLPHYARATVASASKRRKSFPASMLDRTPLHDARPSTSDGCTLPRARKPFAQPASLLRPRLSTAQSARSGNEHEDMLDVQSPIRMTPVTSAVKIPKECFPGLPPRGNWSLHSPLHNMAAAAAEQTPTSAIRKYERFPGLPPHGTYDVAEQTPTSSSHKQERFPGLPPRQTYEEHVGTPKVSTSIQESLATPRTTGKERFPGLPPRKTYELHAKTASIPSRFRTPIQSPAKRPSTAQKPVSLRKLALGSLTPRSSHTPVRTPLKAPATTPGQIPMTPHPAAPLKGVIAMVEVFTNDGAPASAAFIALLQRLGAKTTKTWSERVTHVVWKEGSPATLQKLRLHNKGLDEGVVRAFCINSRWVSDCEAEGKRMDESDEAYAVDVDDVTRANKRRRKSSMEPSALMNIGGNVVRDRKSSLGRSSLGRSPMVFASPKMTPKMTPKMDLEDKENNGDDTQSPATPAYLAAPNSLVQQTAPMKRVRKLDLQGREEAKNRRLTFWNGGAF